MGKITVHLDPKHEALKDHLREISEARRREIERRLAPYGIKPGLLTNSEVAVFDRLLATPRFDAAPEATKRYLVRRTAAHLIRLRRGRSARRIARDLEGDASMIRFAEREAAWNNPQKVSREEAAKAKARAKGGKPKERQQPQEPPTVSEIAAFKRQTLDRRHTFEYQATPKDPKSPVHHYVVSSRLVVVQDFWAEGPEGARNYHRDYYPALQLDYPLDWPARGALRGVFTTIRNTYAMQLGGTDWARAYAIQEHLRHLDCKGTAQDDADMAKGDASSIARKISGNYTILIREHEKLRSTGKNIKQTLKSTHADKSNAHPATLDSKRQKRQSIRETFNELDVPNQRQSKAEPEVHVAQLESVTPAKVRTARKRRD